MRSTNKRFTALSALAMAAACFGFVSAAQAQEVTANGWWKPSCSLRTLRGAYGVKLDGIVQANRETPTPERKLNVVATVTFDGAGKFDAKFVGRINGDPITATLTGEPYTVNANCTGSMKLTQVFRGFSDVPASFVIVDRGDELFIVVDANTLPTIIQASGEAERIGKGRSHD